MRISDWSSDVCSSDLKPGAAAAPRDYGFGPRRDRPRLEGHGALVARRDGAHRHRLLASLSRRPSLHGPLPQPRARSEEHTSELQSLMRISYAVFCLKKKTHMPYP